MPFRRRVAYSGYVPLPERQSERARASATDLTQDSNGMQVVCSEIRTENTWNKYWNGLYGRSGLFCVAAPARLLQ